MVRQEAFSNKTRGERYQRGLGQLEPIVLIVDPNESSQVTDRAVLVLSPVEGSCIRKHTWLEGDIDDMIQRRSVGKR
jgi:hypothetical protein